MVKKYTYFIHKTRNYGEIPALCVRYMELLTMEVGSDTQGQGQGNDQEGADTQGQGQGGKNRPARL